MASIDYTLVLGVDAKHLRQLSWSWPTWARHKPDVTNAPLVIFYDNTEVSEDAIVEITGRKDASMIPWPPDGIVYKGDPSNKFSHPQRYKMLAGFVHVPAMCVSTPYWLKLDTDVVATGKPNWINGTWFNHNASIVSHRWGFTKPPDQIVRLDRWVYENRKSIELLAHKPPLNMAPDPASDRICHPRIISWCGFFSTPVTRYASECAEKTCGRGQLPVPSQDGLLWYVTQRLGHNIARVNMKAVGWQHWSTDDNVRHYAMEAMK